LGFIIRRLLATVPVVFVVSFVVFGMIFLAGDPAVLMLPPEATREDLEFFRELHGFNDPFLVQYWRFLTNALQGDFGRSLRFNRPALEMVLQRLPATLQLSGLSMLIATLISLPLGVIGAIKRNTVFDWLASMLAVIGQSMPNYWLGFLLVIFFAVHLGLLPTSGGPGLRFAILPAATIAIQVTALITRMTRSSVLEVLGQDYVRTARSKGLAEPWVIIRHVLRNSMLPVITVIALQFGYILGGAVVIETIFVWPGLGLLTIQAINMRDYPVVQASVLFLSLSFVLINLTVDILYQFLDPRTKKA
jgi:peptide/nickel transport system permease protein